MIIIWQGGPASFCRLQTPINRAAGRVAKTDWEVSLYPHLRNRAFSQGTVIGSEAPLSCRLQAASLPNTHRFTIACRYLYVGLEKHISQVFDCFLERYLLSIITLRSILLLGHRCHPSPKPISIPNICYYSTTTHPQTCPVPDTTWLELPKARQLQRPRLELGKGLLQAELLVLALLPTHPAKMEMTRSWLLERLELAALLRLLLWTFRWAFRRASFRSAWPHLSCIRTLWKWAQLRGARDRGWWMPTLNTTMVSLLRRNQLSFRGLQFLSPLAKISDSSTLKRHANQSTLEPPTSE